jgi:hypothetical protein
MTTPVSHSPYPPIRDGLVTGLLLFGCAFNGGNDGAHLRKAGLRCTVVDTDNERIEIMRPHYPRDWTFVCCDAFRFAADARRREARFDVVSVDPFSNDADRVFESIESLLMPIARRMLVVGVESKNIVRARRLGASIVVRNERWSWAWWSW